jgi:lysophospholipase L1-like esterase
MAPVSCMRLRSLVAAGLLVASIYSAAPAVAEDRRVLVFGDSISWGWIPTEKGFPAERYPDAERRPTIMAETLGPGYRVSVNAVSGRTTDVELWRRRHSVGLTIPKSASSAAVRCLKGS